MEEKPKYLSNRTVIGQIRHHINHIIIHIVMCFSAVTCIYPLVWMLLTSLKTETEFQLNVLGLPINPQFSNYAKAFELGEMGKYFFNSFFNTIISCIFTILFTFIVGYILARFSFRGRNLIYMFFLSGMLIPIYALLVPIFIEFRQIKILDKWYTLLLPYIAFALPVGIFLVDSFVKALPIDLEEYSYIEGSTFTRTMFIIMMPICKPVLATIFILTFLRSWNEFPLALVLISENKYKTIPLGIRNFVGAYSTSYTFMMAALVMSIIPVVILYVFAGKQIMKGMIGGAIKG